VADPELTALLELARKVVEDAGAGEQLEAYVSRSRSTDVKVFGGEVESLAVAQTEGVGIRVIVDHRQGYSWAGSLDADVVTDALAEARDNAAFAQPDEWQALISPGELESSDPVTLDLWRDSLLTVPASAKVDLALELERATTAADPRVRGVEEVMYSDTASETAIASSSGVEGSARRTMCSCGSFAMAGEGGETQTGYGFSAGRAFEDLDLERAASDAADRATRLLGARPIRSTRLPVIFDPLVTRSLLSLIGSALNGEAVLKGRSMFVGREGENVATAALTLVDDPRLSESFGASTYDAEGVPTRRVELIVDGVLRGYLHNGYTGRRSGTGTTGSAVRGGFKSAPGVGARSLHAVPGPSTPDELFRAFPEALYVQSVSGVHSGTNPVSGDFSVGAEGLIVRDGSFAEPVREVTVASTLLRMLLEIAGIGSDLVWLPGGAAGLTLLIGEMSISGT